MNENEKNNEAEAVKTENTDLPAKKKDAKEKQPFIDELLDYAKIICCTVAIIILIFTFVAKDARVNGPSMNPTLTDGDFLVLSSFFYTPKQGDIVACNSESLGKVIIKRIVATGGQKVTIDFSAGKVYVDGEEFLVDGIQNITTLHYGWDITDVTVPDGKYFVLGDNRQVSNDSRNPTVGFIDREDILGKAVIRLYPFDKIRTF